MPNLIFLKKRITTTISTKKITSAMKMVSVAKLKKTSHDIESVSNYSRHILKILKDIHRNQDIENIDISDSNPNISDNFMLSNIKLFKKSFDKVHMQNDYNKDILPILLVVISPDKGLCGSLNTNIINILNKQISLLKKQNKNFIIIPIGKKVSDYCNQKYKSYIHYDFNKMDLKNINHEKISYLSDSIVDLFISSKISSSFVIYSRFVSVIKQEIVCKAFIPFFFNDELQSKDFSDNKDVFNPLFEPCIEKVISSLVHERIKSAILTFTKNTEASEHAARMMAMDNATKNSDKVIKNLKLKYNRTRQSYITSQILEIVGGMEAVS